MLNPYSTPDLADDGIVRFIVGWILLGLMFVFCWLIYKPYEYVMLKLFDR